MICDININRSGKAPKSAALPAQASGVKIAQNQDATQLDYDVVLIAPTASGCQLLSYDDYFNADRHPTNVYALLCTSDPLVDNCLIVHFVASVFGLSEEFQSPTASGSGYRTICMVVQSRPGQIGAYSHVADFVTLWNVASTSVTFSSPTVFRPSYDELILNPGGQTRLKSATSFEAGGVFYRLFDPETSEMISGNVVAVSHMTEGSALDLSQANLLSDGLTVSPATDNVEGMSINYNVRLWDVLGLYTDESSAQLYWSGLRYDPTSRNVSVVAMRSGALSSPLSKIPSSDTIYVGVIYDYAMPPSQG